jgi:hypothetical protein
MQNHFMAVLPEFIQPGTAARRPKGSAPRQTYIAVLLSPTFFAFRKKCVQKSKPGVRSNMYTQHAAIINDTMQFLFHGLLRRTLRTHARLHAVE